MLANPIEKKSGLYENRGLIAALLLWLVLANLPIVRYVLYPFELFSTWIHELCHGLAALAMGGRFERLEIFSDTSGRALTAIADTRFSKVVVASAGYVGTAFLGVMMLFLQRPTKASRILGLGVALVLGLVALVGVRGWAGGLLYVALIGVFGVMSLGTTEEDTGRVGLGAFGVLLLVSALYGRDLFTLAVLLGWSAGCLALAWRGSMRITRWAFTFLSAACALNALTSLRVLFSAHQVVNGLPAKSDATAVSDVLFGPSVLWSGIWMLLSLGMLYVALRRLWHAPTLQIRATSEFSSSI